MQLLYTFFVLLTLITLGCSGSYKVIKPQPETKTEEVQQLPEPPCDEVSCDTPKVPEKAESLDDRFYHGKGWDMILPEGWQIGENENANLYSTFQKGDIYIIGSITLVEDQNCLWSFSRNGIESLSNNPNIKVLDSVIVEMGGVKNVVALFAHQDEVIGLQAFTAFNNTGYITVCLGNFKTEDDIVFILDRCSDFSNGIKFSTVKQPPIQL